MTSASLVSEQASRYPLTSRSCLTLTMESRDIDQYLPRATGGSHLRDRAPADQPVLDIRLHPPPRARRSPPPVALAPPRTTRDIRPRDAIAPRTTRVIRDLS